MERGTSRKGLLVRVSAFLMLSPAAGVYLSPMQ
jgi:hypothetical protein